MLNQMKLFSGPICCPETREKVFKVCMIVRVSSFVALLRTSRSSVYKQLVIGLAVGASFTPFSCF